MNAPETKSPPPAPPVESGVPEPRRRIPLMRIGFILLGIAIVAAIAGYLPRLHQSEQAEMDIGTLSASTVSLVSPEPGKGTDGLVLPAEVQPLLQASIFARVSGYLKKWNVDIGTRVTAGQVLAEIDTPELDRQLDQARAELNVAEANLKLAQTTDARWKTLVTSNTVSKQEADEKAAAVVVNSASLEAQRANVRRLEETQAFQRVVAPFDGIITIRNVDMGDLVTAGGGRELFHIGQTDKLRVYVRVPQTQAADVRTGQSAEVLIPEMPEEKFPAKVTATSESMSVTSRTLLTELQVDNKKGLIRIGSYAQVRFAGVTSAPLLTLPASVLLFRAQGLQVAAVNDKGIVELRKIELGRDFGQRVEILTGVTAQDKVIANPFDSIVNGMSVRVVQNTPLKE